MFIKYKLNKKEKNIIEKVFKIPSISVILSPSGFLFLWWYSRNIDKLHIYPQLELSSGTALFVLFFFFILYFYLFLPFLFIRGVFLVNISVKENDNLLYAINQSMAMLFWLVLFLIPEYNSYNVESKVIFIILTFILISLIIISFLFLTLESKGFLLFFKFTFFSFLSSLFFIVPLIVFFEVSDNDKIFLYIVIVYLFLLAFFNNYYLSNVKNKRLFPFFIIITVLFIIFLLNTGNSFKLQRMILKPIGIAQSPSQSGWYLLKNGDFLELIESNKYKKHVITINERTYTYINGYLILNIGNIRVICPHDFETTDNQKANDQNLDFSRCLSLTSEDIKFMKRGSPNNDKGPDDNKKADVSKETENSKKIKGNKN